MKISNKKFSGVVRSILLLIMCSLLAGCGNQDATETDNTGKTENRYTVMVYMVGSNLESEAAAASVDIVEMIDSGIDLSKTNVVIYAGGSEQWTLGIPAAQNTVMELTQEDPGIEVVAGTSESENMGEAETFADFLNYCYENYPSEHYALICWDHGGGPINGFGNDELFDYDSLLLPEMEEALEASPFGENQKLDWVGFDACLMASVEVAELWSDYADYLVASQETEAGCGWDYSFLSALNETEEAEEICKSAVDAYGQYFEDNTDTFFQPDATLSCMKLSEMENTIEAMDALFEEMSGELDVGGYHTLSKSRDLVKRYGEEASGGRGNSLDLIDMGDMAEKLQSAFPEEAAELSEQIEKLVIYETSNVYGTSGVSIYYPYDNKEFYQLGGQYLYEEVNTSEGYRTYIRSFTEEWLDETSSTDWTMSKAFIKEDDGELTLALTEEQQEQLSSAYYTILLKQEDDVYLPVLSECKILPDEDGVLHVDLDQQVFCVETDMEENDCIWSMKQLEQAEEGTKWITQKCGVSVTTILEIYESASVSVLVDKNANTHIQNILSAEEEEYSGKQNIDVSQWEYFFWLSSGLCPVYDSRNQLLPYSEWERDSVVRQRNMLLDDSFQFTMENTSDREETFVCQIVAVDTKGNTYASELAELPQKETSVVDTVSQKTAEGEMVFDIYEDHAKLVSYTGEDETAEVPAKVKNVPVTVIGERAFSPVFDGETEDVLKQVVLPESICRIEDMAFSSRKSLGEINLPEGLTYIGEYAFDSCFELNKAELPETVTKIGTEAFAFCAFSEVFIPASVQSIGKGAFANIEELEGITVDEENTSYVSKDGVLFTKDEKTLIAYPTGAVKTEYTIPSGTQTIAGRAFYGADKLEKVEFADSVKEIGNMAFASCSALAQAELPENLEMIGHGAFWMITEGRYDYENDVDISIGTISIGSKVKLIGQKAFCGCNVQAYEVDGSNENYSSKDGFLLNKNGDALLSCPDGMQGSAALPEGICIITKDAFEKCDSITELVLPDSLIAINELCYWPSDLQQLKVGKNLSKWGNVYYLGSCIQETEVEISEENNFYQIQDGSIYSYDGSVLYCASIAEEQSVFAVPDGVTEIGEGAFAYMADEADEIRIPEGVTCLRGENIYLSSYDDREGPLQLYLPESLTEIDRYAITVSADSEEESASLLVIHCKKGSAAEAYALEQGFAIAYTD